MSILNDFRRYGTDQERDEWDEEVRWEYSREWEDVCRRCETCMFYAYNDETDTDYCNNEGSEHYGEATMYDSRCEEWEGE